jgi:AraC-like DNA-binding protein
LRAALSERRAACEYRSVFIIFDADRPSDSPFVERVWRCHSEGSGDFLSVASSHWEMVVTKLGGATTLTLRGPETKAREVHCPANGEWLGVRFKAGTFMPQLPVGNLLDGRDVTLPQASSRSFVLDGARWEYPSFENAEVFVARLLKAGVIARDNAVEAALQGDSQALSRRTAQRHFLYATGMTYGALRQIERARHATNLLRRGVAIADTVEEAGFFDQPHLTRSLRTLIGLTPAKIAREERQLSFLYNTAPPDRS